MSPTRGKYAGSVTGKDLAVLADEPYSTIDYWAKMGLLDFRRVGNRRLFVSSGSIARCKRIRELQNAGLNLTAIKQDLARQ